MTSNNRDVRLTLGVAVEGVEGVEKLASELDALALEGKSTAGAFEVGGVAAGQLQEALQNLTTAAQQQRAAEAAAQADTKAARRTLDEQRDALARLRLEYATAGGNADKYKSDVLQLRTAILDARVALRSKQDALVSATAAARTAGTAEQQLASEIKLAATALLTQPPAYQQAATSSRGATQQQIAHQKELRDSVASVGKQLQSIQQIATIALGGSYAGGLIKDLGETADAVKNLSARVKLATGDGHDFTSSMDGITGVSLRTHSALEETGTLFTRLATAGKEAGLSAQTAQVQALGLTETINQAVQLSGSSAEASNAAITQLIQGLQSGVLRGEEFNSVMEQAPRLARALAQGLNVTTGELRKMAEQGQLTTTTVINALRGQADVVNAEFQQLPLTIGRALQDLKTQWMLYVGAADNGMVSSQNAAKIIEALSNNLDTLVSTLLAAGKAWAAFKIAGLAGDVLTWAMNTSRATVATELQTAAVAANTAVQSTNTAAQIANTAAVTGNATARTGAAAAMAAGTAAATAGAAAQATLATQTAAAAGKAASAGIVWRAFTGLFSPWGLVLASLAPEIKRLGEMIGATAAKWMGWEKVLKAAEEKMRANEAAAKAQIEAQIRQNQLLQEARDRQFELTKAGAALVARFDEMRSKGDSAAEAIGKIGKDFDLGSMPGIRDASAVLDKLLSNGKITADEFRAAWDKSLNGIDLGVFEVEARAALKGISRESEQLSHVMDVILREAIKRTGVEFDILQGGIGAASRKASNDIDAIISGLDRLKAQGVDTTRALSISFSKAIDTADSEKALDELRAKIESVRAALGNKIADGLLDQAAQKSIALKNALEDVLPGIQGVREAMRQLGITSDETLKNTAAQSEKAYRTVATSGTASARELTEAFKKYASDAIAANNGIASEAIKAEAAVRGLVVSTDATGKAVIQTAAEAAKAIGKVGDAYGKAGDAAVNASDRAITALERQNAAQERLNAAVEKAADLERKRIGVDKQGFSADKDGNRIVMESDLGTRTGIAAFLKAAGVADDAAARRIASEFADSQGNIPYVDNPGQRKYGGAGSTISQALLKAAEQYTFGGTRFATSTGQAPPRPTSIPDQSRTVNINIPGKSTSVRVASQTDSDNLVSFLRQLESAAGTAT